jgi:hypothetical protein
MLEQQVVGATGHSASTCAESPLRFRLHSSRSHVPADSNRGALCDARDLDVVYGRGFLQLR